MKNFILLILVSIFFSAYGQSLKLTTSSQSRSCLEKKGLCLIYDADSVLIQKIWYSELSKIDSISYFDLNGKEVIGYESEGNIDLECFKLIKYSIDKQFNWKNVSPQDGQGTVMVSFFITSSLEIEDIRILSGIHKSLNDEVKRAVGELEKDVYQCALNTFMLQRVIINLKF